MTPVHAPFHRFARATSRIVLTMGVALALTPATTQGAMAPTEPQATGAGGAAGAAASPQAPASGGAAGSSAPGASGSAPGGSADEQGAPQAPAPEFDNGETLWPQKSVVQGTTYIIYTPQMQVLSAVQATARAAFCVQPAAGAAALGAGAPPAPGTAAAGSTPAGSAPAGGAPTAAPPAAPAPIYGVMFFTADTDNDFPAGLIELSNLIVTEIRLPDGSQNSTLKAQLQSMLFGATFTISRAIALENMQVSKDHRASAANLGKQVPKIVVMSQPAVLLLLDGRPVLRPIGATSFGAAQNTASLLLKDKSSGTWYTRLGAATWLNAQAYTGPWLDGSAPPAAVLAELNKSMPPRHPDAAAQPPTAGSVEPQVVVSTTPMCLVSINGAPDLQQAGPDLYAVGNANCDLFTTQSDNQWFLLASGRWFKTSDLLNGPWSYVASSALPAGFAQIDPKGSWGNVLACVAGTPQANAALYESSVPHVATLDRALAKTKPTILGESIQFKGIAGTDMKYAVNSSSPLIACQGKFYLCDNAAWFVSTSAEGPWALCDSVPAEIYTIPPSCPVYPCTYVQVYGSTPDAVTQGYTGGYMGSYANDGAVAYGTGYSQQGYSDTDCSQDSDQSDCWGTYMGYPNTYGYWPMYGDGWGGWGFGCMPGWGAWGLGYGPTWCASGWWGPGAGFGLGYGLGMGYGDSWSWGWHPWGAANRDGWWGRHWGGAYRSNWDNAARGYNRAAAAGDIGRYGQIGQYGKIGQYGQIGHYGQIGPYAKTPGGANALADRAANRGAPNDANAATTRQGESDVARANREAGGSVGAADGAGQWSHAAGTADNVYANRDGSVTQRRGDQMYTRTAGGWHAAGTVGAANAANAAGAAGAGAAGAAQRTANGTWRDGVSQAPQGNQSWDAAFREGDASAAAAARARGADDSSFRPDPNHNYDGSPRGAYARGETDYASNYSSHTGVGTAESGANQGNSAYNRGGSGWNGGAFHSGGGGWGNSDQVGTAAQRYGGDYDRGTPGYTQDWGWQNRSVSRPANPYGGGYSGWSNGYRGAGNMTNGYRSGGYSGGGYRGGDGGGARGGGGGGRR